MGSLGITLDTNPPTLVSIIIPTCNRKDSLLRTLDSLKQQTLPTARFEVVVVDDGSTDDTREVAELDFPFALNYTDQANSGDALARNTGAQRAEGEYLVFVDDDITLEMGCLSAFLDTLRAHQHAIVVGNLKAVLPEPLEPFHLYKAHTNSSKSQRSDDGRISFTACLSGFMAIRRSDYFAIGMMQGLNPRGANAWCDVDFGYRAHKLGYSFYLGQDAVGRHYDAASSSLGVACERARRVSHLAVELFRKHPDLLDFIPMFRDKAPIDWRRDSPRPMARKLARQLSSSRPAVWMMERLVSILERCCPSFPLLSLFYRWIISAYIYQGYRQGLRDLASADHAP
jgi:glycosyltransferase involved in cell wall biosynthesis